MPGEDTNCPPKEMADLVQHCERTKLDLIICTDSNAHHPLWGSDASNSRGEIKDYCQMNVKKQMISDASSTSAEIGTPRSLDKIKVYSVSNEIYIKNGNVGLVPSISNWIRTIENIKT